MASAGPASRRLPGLVLRLDVYLFVHAARKPARLFLAGQIRHEPIGRPLGPLLRRRLLHASNLPFELVQDLIDRRVHVFARLVRVEVLSPGLKSDLDVMEAMILTTE